MQTPFHEGELAVQQRAGEAWMAERNGAIISDKIMGGALPFLAQQPMAVFSTRDAASRLWASVLFGSRGFMHSDDGHTLDLNLAQMTVQQSDPFWRNIEANPAVGMLAIDLGTRRRIRINGEISRPSQATLRLSVREAFPNCPKYITRRVVSSTVSEVSAEMNVTQGTQLGPLQQNLLARADLLFLATAHPTRGADASHRGGNPGFIQVAGDAELRIPDYPGNSMFNSLGNLVVDPSAGLVVPDFEHRRVLQLTGRAKVAFDKEDPRNTTGGTGRFLLFKVDEWLEQPLPAGLHSETLDASPFNPVPLQI